MEVLEGLFSKIIDLQKLYGQNDLSQKINLEFNFGTRFIDLLSSRKTILESLMKGFSLNLNMQLLNKLDEIVLTLFKMLEEQAKKEESKTEEKKTATEKEKEEEEAKQAQKHMIHMASLILKTKMNAEFKMDYIEGSFQNDLLNLFGKGVRDFLLTSPSKAVGLLKVAGEAFETITEKKNEEAKANSENLNTIFYEILNNLTSLVESFKGIISYIRENQTSAEADEEEDQIDPDELVNTIF